MLVNRCRVTCLGVATLALSGLAFAPYSVSAQSCTQTLSAGANVASVVSSAAAGSTICLNSGSYGSVSFGSFTKSPRVTVSSVTGQGASMSLSFSGTNGVTIDSVTVTSANFSGSATKNITVQNSAFTGVAVFDGPVNSNILLTNNTHNNIEGGGQYVYPARLHFPYVSQTHSGITIQNSIMDGGSADGVQASVGVNIIGNVFKNIAEGSCTDCHTDAIQLLSAPGTVIRNNYIYNCSTGIVAFDGVQQATIEDNIVDTNGRPWGIELYADNGSIVRHNTLPYRAGCFWNQSCGKIYLDHKSGDPAGTGTVIVDNIATSIEVNNGSTYSQRTNNLVRTGAISGEISGAPTYVGGSTPTTIAGFQLMAGSLGKTAASSPAGSDIGVTIGASSLTTSTLSSPTNFRIIP